MKILLSIKPEYVNRILDGSKKYEYRTSIAKTAIESIIIYSTSPDMKIVGEVKVDGILEMSPTKLWELTKKDAGISRAKFREYFQGRKVGYAYILGNVTAFDPPRPLESYGLKYAPQSFVYISIPNKKEEMAKHDKTYREQYFLEQEELLLKGGASFSEWCTFISKSVYDAFVNGADLATIITAMACIETYLKAEIDEYRNNNLVSLIDTYPFFNEEVKQQLHRLRKYRNSWVHDDSIDDVPILSNQPQYIEEVEKMAFLAVKLMLTVLFSQPYI
jgi:Uncharacterized conserved protein